MTNSSEWQRILTLLLENKIEASPIYMTHEMFIQQYQRALNKLRKLFGKVNVECVVLGRTSNGKKRTKYVLIRNEHTEKILDELKKDGLVDKSLYFNYPRKGESQTKIEIKASSVFPSASHQIAHENRLKYAPKTDQLTLSI